MSAPSASASFSPISMANQEILATMGRIDIMLAQVRNSQSDQEKLRLSKAIGLEVNKALNTDARVATHIPLRLISVGAVVYRALNAAGKILKVPDWDMVGNNEDLCRSHPLYRKTLGGSSVNVPVDTAPSLVPVPASAPVPAPAPAPAQVPTAPSPAPASPQVPVPSPAPASPQVPVPSPAPAPASGSAPAHAPVAVAAPPAVTLPLATPPQPAPATAPAAEDPVPPAKSSAPVHTGAVAAPIVPQQSKRPMSDVDLVAGPSKPQKRPMSPSQPAPKAKRPKKNGPKSKEVLSDTDVDESQNTPPAPKAKRPKKKSKAFLSDTDDEDRTSGKAQSLPKIICQPPVTVVPDVIDDGKGKRKRAKQTAQPDDIEDGDNSPVDKGKRKRAGPRPTGPKIPKPTRPGPIYPPCKRCVKNSWVCKTWKTKSGELGSTCDRCRLVKMTCLQDGPAESAATTTPAPAPVVPGPKPKAKRVKAKVTEPQPRPIPEDVEMAPAPDAAEGATRRVRAKRVKKAPVRQPSPGPGDVEMVDLTTPPPSAPATGANQAPTPSPVINSTSVVRRKPYIDVNSDDELTPPPNDRASPADFPDDHWQEPNSDDLMPPARTDVKPRDSTPPTDPPAVIVPPAPLPTAAPPALPLPITAPLAIATPSNDHRHSEGQHAVTMQDLEAEINNIRREMEAIRVQHRDEHTRIEARLTQQARVNARLQHGVDSQWALLKTMNVQIEAMLTFSRASRGANNPITPPPFDPNPVFTRPPTFDMAESISPFARRFTNDVFPVTRQVPVESPVTPTRVPAASGAPAPMLAGTSNGPVRAQDKGNM